MTKHQYRTVSIQDISCFGKCSETVALPILSAAGVETVILPTALLSTHTGGIAGYTYLDLADQLDPISDHWKKLGLQFDGIITGYLGSAKMIDQVGKIIGKLKNSGTLVMSDPAMADNGKLYPAFDLAYARQMKGLCDQADIVIPNITEACLMTGSSYREGPYDKEYIEGLLKKLTEGGAKIAVLTGVYFNNEELGAGAYDSRTGKYCYRFAKRIDGYYHGTGDIFAAAFFGDYLRNRELSGAIGSAVSLTVGSIERTQAAHTDIRFGVDFEEGLREYAEQVSR